MESVKRAVILAVSVTMEQPAISLIRPTVEDREGHNDDGDTEKRGEGADLCRPGSAHKNANGRSPSGGSVHTRGPR